MRVAVIIICFTSLTLMSVGYTAEGPHVLRKCPGADKCGDSCNTEDDKFPCKKTEKPDCDGHGYCQCLPLEECGADPGDLGWARRKLNSN